MDVRTIFLLLLSGICVTVPFQNLTIMIVIWDQLVWRKQIKLLRCCSILLTRSTNWATAISTEYCSHCFPLLTSCAFPSSGGICWVPLQKFQSAQRWINPIASWNPSSISCWSCCCFSFHKSFFVPPHFSISCNFFLESLSPWLQSVLMPAPLEQHRITVIEFPVR